MAEVEIIAGPAAGQVFAITKTTTIGRGEDVDLQLNDESVSRQHARLVKDKQGHYILFDLESHNGTLVNRERVNTCLLREGDEIRVGRTVMIFHADNTSVAAQTAQKTRFDLVGEESTTVVNTIAVDALGAGPPPTGAGAFADARTAYRSLHEVCEMFRSIGVGGREDELLETVLATLFRVFPDTDRGFIVLRNPQTGALTPAATRGVGGPVDNRLELSQTIIQYVLDRKQAVLSTDAMTDGRFGRSDTIMGLGLRSVMCAPLRTSDTVLGFISLDTQKVSPSYNKDALTLLAGIANFASLAIANARLHKELVDRERVAQDLRNARRIQHSFLPQEPPRVRGYEFAAWYNAAQDVGGDFYDFINLPDGNLGITIGDVSGKGITAALLMAKLTGNIRFLAATGASPAELLARLNKSLADSEADVFVTLLFVALDRENHRLVVANAGHHAPLIRRGDRSVAQAECEAGFPVGVLDETPFPETEIRLEPADRVCLYTDGIVEAMNRDNETYGEQRLVRTLSEAPDGPSEILERIQQSLWQHTALAPQSDDLTLVCFGPTGQGHC